MTSGATSRKDPQGLGKARELSAIVGVSNKFIELSGYILSSDCLAGHLYLHLCGCSTHPVGPQCQGAKRTLADDVHARGI
eukprot:6199262-Pleurochrysis_carterae.AAC.1